MDQCDKAIPGAQERCGLPKNHERTGVPQRDCLPESECLLDTDSGEADTSESTQLGRETSHVLDVPAGESLAAMRGSIGIRDIGLLLGALLCMSLAGGFATIALNITPDDFAPRFTGFRSPLVSEDIPPSLGSNTIVVRVAKEVDVPTNWLCFQERGLPGAKPRDIPPGQLVCMVPRSPAAVPATSADSAPEDPVDAESKSESKAAEPDTGGLNWAGFTSGFCLLAGLVLAGLTQHEKFPWSAASRLASANAKAGLAKLDGQAEPSQGGT